MVEFELSIRLLQIKTLVLHALTSSISYETVNIRIIKIGGTSLKWKLPDDLEPDHWQTDWLLLYFKLTLLSSKPVHSQDIWYGPLVFEAK